MKNLRMKLPEASKVSFMTLKKYQKELSEVQKAILPEHLLESEAEKDEITFENFEGSYTDYLWEQWDQRDQSECIIPDYEEE